MLRNKESVFTTVKIENFLFFSSALRKLWMISKEIVNNGTNDNHLKISVLPARGSLIIQEKQNSAIATIRLKLGPTLRLYFK
jgi:hypothetical protein